MRCSGARTWPRWVLPTGPSATPSCSATRFHGAPRFSPTCLASTRRTNSGRTATPSGRSASWSRARSRRRRTRTLRPLGTASGAVWAKRWPSPICFWSQRRSFIISVFRRRRGASRLLCTVWTGLLCRLFPTRCGSHRALKYNWLHCQHAHISLNN